MASSQTATLKKAYKIKSKLEVFYTGGPICIPASASFVVCPCLDQVKVVDLATSAVTSTFKGDSEPITAISVTPDGKLVFGSSRSLQTRFWSVETGICLRSWKAHASPVSTLASDSSGGLLASGSTTGEVRVWDVEKGFCTHSFKKHSGIVSTLLFHPDPQSLLLFSGGDDGAILVYDLATKQAKKKFEKHFSPVTSFSISASHNKLFSSGRDKVVNVFDIQRLRFVKTIATFDSLEGVCVVESESATSASGELEEPSSGSKKKKKGSQKPQPHSENINFLTVGEKGVISSWDYDSGACMFEQRADVASPDSSPGPPPTALSAVLLSGSALRAVVATADQRIAVLSLRPGSLSLDRQLAGNNDQIVDLAFLDAAENFLAVATNSEQIRVYDVRSMSCSSSLIGHTDILLCLDCSPPPLGALLASGGKDNSVRIWDTVTSRCIGLGTGHMSAVTAVAFSRKSLAFLVSGSSDRTLKVWRLEAMAKSLAEGGPSQPASLQSMAVTVAHDKDINSIAVSPNDQILCSGSQDRTLKLWNLPDLSPRATLKGHRRGIWSVCFSPVDQVVLSASADLTLRVWSVSDASCLKTFEGHTGSVLKAAFLSRGTQIVSSGADGLVKLWTIKTGECVNTFDAHEDKVWALAVSQTTEMLVTGGSDSLVNLWTDCTVEDEQQAIQKQEEEVLKDQALSNALVSEDFSRAIALAFELRRPFKMLSIFSRILTLPDANEKIEGLVAGMAAEDLKLLLEFVREWNTNSKFCHVAHRVIRCVLTQLSQDEILAVSGLREIIEGLIPYSERHLARVDRLVRGTYLLDFTLSSMDVLLERKEGGNEELLDPASKRFLRKKEELRVVQLAERRKEEKEEKKYEKTKRKVLGNGALKEPNSSSKKKKRKTRNKGENGPVLANGKESETVEGDSNNLEVGGKELEL